MKNKIKYLSIYSLIGLMFVSVISLYYLWNYAVPYIYESLLHPLPGINSMNLSGKSAVVVFDDKLYYKK